MSRIKIIQPEEATGRLKEIYSKIEQQRGQIAEVHKIQSLRPEGIVKHRDLYMDIMFSKSQLSRAQREMVAVVVSVTNKCVYCASHHGSALNHYWKDDGKLSKLLADYTSAGLLPGSLPYVILQKNSPKTRGFQMSWISIKILGIRVLKMRLFWMPPWWFPTLISLTEWYLILGLHLKKMAGKIISIEYGRERIKTVSPLASLQETRTKT